MRLCKKRQKKRKRILLIVREKEPNQTYVRNKTKFKPKVTD